MLGQLGCSLAWGMLGQLGCSLAISGGGVCWDS